MDYSLIVWNTFSNDGIISDKPQFLYREFKKAEKENYSLDEFINGCKAILNKLKADIFRSWNERQVELSTIISMQMAIPENERSDEFDINSLNEEKLFCTKYKFGTVFNFHNIYLSDIENIEKELQNLYFRIGKEEFPDLFLNASEIEIIQKLGIIKDVKLTGKKQVIEILEGVIQESRLEETYKNQIINALNFLTGNSAEPITDQTKDKCFESPEFDTLFDKIETKNEVWQYMIDLHIIDENGLKTPTLKPYFLVSFIEAMQDFGKLPISTKKYLQVKAFTIKIYGEEKRISEKSAIIKDELIKIKEFLRKK